MDQIPKRLTGAAMAWTAVVCMAVARTFLQIDGLLIWAMLGCSVAIVCTGWLLAEHVISSAVEQALERVANRDERTLDHVADKLADALESSDNVTRLR